nr:MAG: putative Robin [Culex narnavirus 1]
MGDAPSRRRRRGGGHKPPSANSAGNSGDAVSAGVSPPVPPTGDPALSSSVNNRGCAVEPGRPGKGEPRPDHLAAAAVKAAACRQAVDLALAVVGEPRSAAGVRLVFDKACSLALSALDMGPSTGGTADLRINAAPARAGAPLSTAKALVRRSTGGGGGCALGDSPLAQLAVGVGELDRSGRTPVSNYRRRRTDPTLPQRTEHQAAPDTQGPVCSPNSGHGTAAVRPPGRGQGAAGRGGVVGAHPARPIKGETLGPKPPGPIKQEPKTPPLT